MGTDRVHHSTLIAAVHRSHGNAFVTCSQVAQ
jgi:hypothetical protein